MVSIDKYCQNPSEYQLPDTTREFYNQICSLRKSLSGDFKKLEELAKHLGLTIANLPAQLVMAIASPRGLEMLSVFLGVDIGVKLLGNVLMRAFARGLSADLWKAAIELAEEKGAAFVNTTIIMEVLSRAAEESATIAVFSAVSEAIGEAFNKLSTIFFIVQMLAMVLDSWDFTGWGEELNADGIDLISNIADQQFQNQFLSLVSIGKDAFGNPVYFAHWPVEFMMDRLLSEQKVDYYTTKHWNYFVEYLQNLKVNSDGYSICWPKGGALMSQDDFTHIADQYSMLLADQNTIVAKWMRKYWLIVILVLLLLVVFVLIIR